VGEPPDPRSAEVAARHGIPLEGVARQIRLDDFHDFDLILAMDRDNLQELERLKGSSETRAKLALLREFDAKAEGELNVPDPYYGGPDGFERVFELVHRSCRALLDELRRDGAVGE
jgi:protein-tyrosine phosphatase